MTYKKILWFLLAAHTVFAQSALFDLTFSPDGSRLAVTDRAAHTLSFVDVETGIVTHNVSLDFQPTGLTWPNKLFVSDYSNGRLVRFDPVSHTIDDHFKTSPKPMDVAFASVSNHAVVTGYGLNEIVLLDIIAGERLVSVSAGRFPYFVEISPNEHYAVVGHLIPGGASTDADAAAVVTIFDLQHRKKYADVALPYGSSNVRQVKISPDSRWAYVAHTRGRVNLPTNQLEKGWVNTNAISIFDLENHSLYTTFLLDNTQRGAADPWGLALSPDGKTLWVTLAGVSELGVVNLEKLHSYLDGSAFPDHLKPSDAKAKLAWDVWDTIRRDPSQRVMLQNELSAMYAAGIYRRVPIPAQTPRAIDMSPDGQTLAVAGYFSGNILLMDAETLVIKKNIQISHQTDSTLRRGEILFHDATRSFQGWLSCATCHPDGRSDGLNWDLLNDGIGNPKNSKSLVLSHATPPAMATGVRANFNMAVDAGFKHIQFSAAQPEELRAVEVYLQSMQPEPSPYLVNGKLSRKAKKGKTIFNNERVGCASCHSGEHLTDLKTYDVGTQGELDYVSEFDNPTLRELWRTAPYLHNGSAATLHDVLLEHNKKQLHGQTMHLSDSEVNTLIEFLLSL